MIVASICYRAILAGISVLTNSDKINVLIRIPFELYKIDSELLEAENQLKFLNVLNVCSLQNCQNSLLNSGASGAYKNLFRKQQVVGSNPTTGSTQDQGVTAIPSRFAQFSSDKILTNHLGIGVQNEKPPR